MDATTRLTRYAELAVNVGAAVRPGVTVNLGCDLEHAELAYEIAAAAYRAGAARVIVDYRDVRIRRAALENVPIEALTATDPWEIARVEHMRDTGAAFIRLTGQSDPHAFDGLDPAKLAATPVELGTLMREVLTSGDVSWTILAAPNAGWAEQVFGEPDVERLWDKVAVVMRLDEPDPVAAWRERDAELRARASALDALVLDSVRYHGEGTDLTVGLIPDHVWTGGGLTDVRGARFMPNLPTEEVFTSPDNRRADGVIRLTRPLVLREGVVEGLVVRFEGGRVVDLAADSGVELVRAQHATDEGAPRLGEVSLVDGTSRVRAAGVVFHDTLYDENAGCHVAWGAGFPFAVRGWKDLPTGELEARGLNRSLVHTDVVVGGPGVSVTGKRADGTEVPIIDDDAWVLPVG